MLALDIGALVDVSDPRLSPDGTTVAVVVTSVDLVANVYRSAIWLVAADGSSEPRQVTSGAHRDARPRWAPDGSALAFVSHREDAGSELYVLPLRGGEARLLVSAPEEIEDVAWAPDATRLAFSRRDRDEAQYGPARDADRPPRRITRIVSKQDSIGWIVDRPRHLYVVHARPDAEPQVRQLTHGDAEDGGFTWSRDGTSIVFTSRRTDTWDTDLAVELYRIDAAGAEPPQRLTHDGDALSHPVWSPTDDTVAFFVEPVLDSPRNVQLAVLATDGDGVRVLTAGLDRDCSGPAAPVWDGDGLLFQVNDHGNVPLLRVAADGSSPPEAVLEGDRQITAFDVAAGTLAFTAGDATHLPELFVRSAGGAEKQLTGFADTFHRQAALIEPERFIARSTGGAEVEAWVLRPAGCEQGRRYPTLLNIHGGPFAQYGNRMLDELQVQAGAGYVVLYGNPRGSSGYGEAWARATRGTGGEDGEGWGTLDADDVLAVLDTAIERFDFVDPDRLGVLGGSYGGYLTSWIVGHDHRFRAACAERSLTNFLSYAPVSDIGAWFAKAYFDVDHVSDPDELWLRSPVAYAADIRTPLLLLHSENDLRCPINQAEDLFLRLKLLGREVELVRFPGESHELSRSGAPRHRVERMEIILEWFERHLAVGGSGS